MDQLGKLCWLPDLEAGGSGKPGQPGGLFGRLGLLIFDLRTNCLKLALPLSPENAKERPSAQNAADQQEIGHAARIIGAGRGPHERVSSATYPPS